MAENMINCKEKWGRIVRKFKSKVEINFAN
jgi:hypothetical protein